MRYLRSIVQCFVHLILALVALNAVLSGWWRFAPDPVLVFVNRHLFSIESLTGAAAVRCFWLAVLLLVILYWVLVVAIWRRRPRAIQVRTTGGETMLLHPGALLKFVRLQVENHPAVVSQKIKVRQKGGRGLSISVMVNVQPIDSLPVIKRQLEDSIRDGFAQVMGIEKIDDVTIIIGLDEKSLTRRPGSNVKPQPKPEPPARGALDEDDGPSDEITPSSKWTLPEHGGPAPAEDTEKI